MYPSIGMREFRIAWREEEGVDVLEIAGAVDSRTAVLFGAVVEAVSHQPGGDLRLDCSGISFMSSASVGQLVKLVNERRARGRRVMFAQLPEHLAELFRRMRLETFLGGDPRGSGT